MSNEFTIPTKASPSLEQQAVDAGIDIAAIDNAADQSPAPRPSWLPEKFKSPEDFAKSYSEMERKMRSPKAQADETDGFDADEAEVEDADEANVDSQDEDDAAEKMDKAGIDFDTLRDRFWSEGNGEDLPDDAYEALEKAGIRKEVVKAHIEGQKALVALERANLLSPIGGEEAYAEISEWAAASLSESDLAKYNKAVGGDFEGAKKAVIRIKARYDEANGVEPKRKVSGRPAPAAPRRYESMQQVAADMRNPLYQKDPAYRAKVQAKLANSDL